MDFAELGIAPRMVEKLAEDGITDPTPIQIKSIPLALEGRVVELSWYGEKPVPVVLGGNFHANRLSIICSQVGHVAPVRRAGTSHRDRLILALAALADERLDRLITTETPFHDLPAALPGLLSDDAPGIATRIVY